MSNLQSETKGQTEKNVSRKSWKKKQNKRKRRVLIWLGIILLLLVIGGGIAGGFAFREVHNTVNTVTEQKASIGDTFQTILPGADSSLDQTDGRTNILILGMRGQYDDNGGLLTDSIMIMSIDREEETATLISLPRDLYKSVPGYNGKYKLNRAHALGAQQNPPQGVRTSMDTVSQITGLDIHYGLRLDFVAFEEIVNQLNGVTVHVEKKLVDDNYGGLYVPKGKVKMNGVRARKYVQSRLSTSDFDRSRRQREVVKAIKREMEKQGVFNNPQFVFNLLDSLERHIKTTMVPQEIKAVLKLGKKIQLDSMNTKGFTTSSEVLGSGKNDQGQYIILPVGGDFEPLQARIQRVLSK